MSRTTRTNPTRTRQKAPTNSSFDKNLAAYMLAAGAAGVSLLAAQTAEAQNRLHTCEHNDCIA